MNYTKKPVTIQAWQLNAANFKSGVPDWIDQKQVEIIPSVKLFVNITTLEGEIKAYENDYIIRGVNGEFYPCNPDIFEKTYIREFDTKEHIKELRKLRARADKKLAHIEADKILCNVLRAYGQDELVKEFESMDKWYC